MLWRDDTLGKQLLFATDVVGVTPASLDVFYIPDTLFVPLIRITTQTRR
jgi:hypothetical protein